VICGLQQPTCCPRANNTRRHTFHTPIWKHRNTAFLDNSWPSATTLYVTIKAEARFLSLHRHAILLCFLKKKACMPATRTDKGLVHTAVAFGQVMRVRFMVDRLLCVGHSDEVPWPRFHEGEAGAHTCACLVRIRAPKD
jgi:hypothetical protein